MIWRRLRDARRGVTNRGRLLGNAVSVDERSRVVGVPEVPRRRVHGLERVPVVGVPASGGSPGGNGRRSPRCGSRLPPAEIQDNAIPVIRRCRPHGSGACADKSQRSRRRGARSVRDRGCGRNPHASARVAFAPATDPPAVPVWPRNEEDWQCPENVTPQRKSSTSFGRPAVTPITTRLCASPRQLNELLARAAGVRFRVHGTSGVVMSNP